MRVPASAPPEIQQAFREVWRKLDLPFGGTIDLDLSGRRIRNAGISIDPFDYVTRYEVDQLRGQSGAVLDSITTQVLRVLGTARFSGPVILSAFAEGAIPFFAAGGVLKSDAANLYWDDVNNRLVLGADAVCMWDGRTRMLSPVDGDLVLRDKTDLLFNMLKFGGTTSSYPALKRSGAGFQVRLADDSAYGGITALNFYKANASAYSISNVTTDRTYDANATTLDEVADVLGTVIADLQSVGLVA